MQVNTISTTNTITNTTKSTEKSQSNFKSYLGESQELDTIFQKAADTYGVDVNLLKAIAKTESNFTADATSSAGAMGIMQLMPNTAKALGVSNPYDAEESIMGGAKYISQMLKKYDGDVKLALASYNAGPGNVAKYGGIPPFKETQNYVTKVISAYQGNSSSTTSTTKTNTTIAASTVGSTSATNASVEASLENASMRWDILSANRSDRLNSYVSLISEYTRSKEIDELFSYMDYLKFVDSITNQQEEEEEETKTEMASQTAAVQLSSLANHPLLLRTNGIL